MKFFATLIVTLLGGFILYESFYQPTNTLQPSISIDGVYNLVSETTILSKPKATQKSRKSPDWSGLYHFQNGYFSIVLMNQTRKMDWFTKFPKNVEELGFESFAGKYEITGKTLVLKPELALHPFYGSRLRTFEFKTEKENLILTENIYPYPENVSEGQRVLVLHKIK